MKKDSAEQLADISLRTIADFNSALCQIRENESQEVFDDLRRKIAGVLTSLILEVLNPIYGEHPELEPASKQMEDP